MYFHCGLMKGCRHLEGSVTFMHVIMKADLFLKCKKLSPFTCISNMAEPHQLSDA